MRSGWYTHTAVFTDNRNSRTQICAINHFSSHAHTRRHTSRWVIWALTTPLLHFHSSIFFWDTHSHTHAGSRGYKKKAFSVLVVLHWLERSSGTTHNTLNPLRVTESANVPPDTKTVTLVKNEFVYVRVTSFLFSVSSLWDRWHTWGKQREKGVKVVSHTFKASSMLILFLPASTLCWIWLQF